MMQGHGSWRVTRDAVRDVEIIPTKQLHNGITMTHRILASSLVLSTQY